MTMRREALALPTDPALALPGNVIAFAVPDRTGSVGGSKCHGEQLEESGDNYRTIELALEDGSDRLRQLRETKHPARDPDVARIIRRGV